MKIKIVIMDGTRRDEKKGIILITATMILIIIVQVAAKWDLIPTATTYVFCGFKRQTHLQLTNAWLWNHHIAPITFTALQTKHTKS